MAWAVGEEHGVAGLAGGEAFREPRAQGAATAATRAQHSTAPEVGDECQGPGRARGVEDAAPAGTAGAGEMRRGRARARTGTVSSARSWEKGRLPALREGRGGSAPGSATQRDAGSREQMGGAAAIRSHVRGYVEEQDVRALVIEWAGR